MHEWLTADGRGRIQVRLILCYQRQSMESLTERWRSVEYPGYQHRSWTHEGHRAKSNISFFTCWQTETVFILMLLTLQMKVKTPVLHHQWKQETLTLNNKNGGNTERDPSLLLTERGCNTKKRKECVCVCVMNIITVVIQCFLSAESDPPFLQQWNHSALGQTKRRTRVCGWAKLWAKC